MSVLVGSGANIFGITVEGTASPVCWSVQFFKENDAINFGSGANIDNLPTGDCTIECWAKVPNTGFATFLLTKKPAGAFGTGWDLLVQATGIPLARIAFAGNSVQLAGGSTMDNQWHHYAVDFDVGTLTGRLFIDGTVVATDGGAGAYVSAAANDCIVNGYNAVGTDDQLMTIGWVRLSSSRRYTGASFDPGERNIYPTPDANTQLLAYMADGAGVTATDESGNGYDGTITFGAHTQWINEPV